MAIDIVEDADTGTLQVTASGKLTSDNYKTFEPSVVEMIENVGKIKVLFIMKDFHGWEPDAVWDDIKFATKHYRDIEKLAMVGEKEWERWMAALCKAFTSSTINYFGAGQEDEAKAWLES